jgi:hypothetical protein
MAAAGCRARLGASGPVIQIGSAGASCPTFMLGVGLVRPDLRPMLDSGELARRIADDAVTGVTSNPSASSPRPSSGSTTTTTRCRNWRTATRTPRRSWRPDDQDLQRACDALRRCGSDRRPRRPCVGRGRSRNSPTRPSEHRRGTRVGEADRPAQPPRQGPGHPAGIPAIGR